MDIEEKPYGREDKFHQQESVIYRQGDPPSCWYEVRQGFVMLCRYFANGRRQVARFVGPGEAFGFECGSRQFSAECLTNTQLIYHCVQDVEQSLPCTIETLGPHPAMQRALQSLEDAMRLFRYGNALERVAAFILGFSAYSENPNMVTLPMSRQDLADHLGLTMHTVSRSIRDLARRGYFHIEKPDLICIKDRKELEWLVEYEPNLLHDRIAA